MTGHVQRDCRCGASYRGSSLPVAVAEQIAELFDREHSGDGHAPATPAEASRARARAEARADW